MMARHALPDTDDSDGPDTGPDTEVIEPATDVIEPVIEPVTEPGDQVDTGLDTEQDDSGPAPRMRDWAAYRLGMVDALLAVWAVALVVGLLA